MIRQLLFWSKPLRYLWDSLTYPRREREYITTWKNRYAGKPLLVVGNGPSLNQTPLDQFCDIPSIGMNKINLLFERTQWRPSLIVCANNLVAGQNKDFFASSTIPILLSWKNRWFLRGINQQSVHFFLSGDDRSFQHDPSLLVGSAGTVTFTALQMAYYMGANPVILFGVDHNFSVSASSKSNDIQKMTTEDANHFHKDYFAKGQYWGIPNLELSEEGYRQAKAAFEADGREILDASVGGKLQVFRKISVEEAERICQRNIA